MLAFVIFLATLLLVVWQPRGLGIGWSASAGAASALLTGVVRPADIATVWHIVWDATFTFVALIVISLLLDRAGFFRWAALHVARWGGGRGRRLYPLVVLLGAELNAAVQEEWPAPDTHAKRFRWWLEGKAESLNGGAGATARPDGPTTVANGDTATS